MGFFIITALPDKRFKLVSKQLTQLSVLVYARFCNSFNRTLKTKKTVKIYYYIQIMQNVCMISEICPPADTAVEGFEFKKKEDYHPGAGVRHSILQSCPKVNFIKTNHWKNLKILSLKLQ